MTHTAQDELFAAVEGAAFHTRVILEHMERHSVPIVRVINGGGIPQRNQVLNQVYANVLNKPVLVPAADVTSLGSAIFAFLAAGAFANVQEAQRALCPDYRIFEPRQETRAAYDELFAHFTGLYFEFGRFLIVYALVPVVFFHLWMSVIELRNPLQYFGFSARKNQQISGPYLS